MYVFIENCAHKSKNVYLNITILQKFCDKDFDIVNSWALTVQFQNVHSLLKLLKIHCSGHLNLCLEFLNDLKLQVNISSLTEMKLDTLIDRGRVISFLIFAIVSLSGAYLLKY